MTAGDGTGVGDLDVDLLREIIEEEIQSYVRIACATALAGLGDHGDEPAQRRIVNEMQHLHLAEPWLPASKAAHRIRAARLGIDCDLAQEADRD